MLGSLWVNNYRTFNEFRVEGLSRVNLFVGTNNCGKTTLLEAAECLSSAGDPFAVLRSLMRRAERIPGTSEDSSNTLDVSHLFHGHHWDEGTKFVVGGLNDGEISVSCEITAQVSGEQEELPLDELGKPLRLLITYPESNSEFSFELSDEGGISIDSQRRHSRRERQESRSVQFITTSGVEGFSLRRLWNKVALTAEEDAILNVLRIIDPEIERIAFIESGRHRFPYDSAPSGVYLKLSGEEDRVPLGSMGEGTSRLLGLSLSLIRSARGALLIDEIDTGLHHSVLEQLWKIIIRTARDLDIQVFATTHSLDCVRSLAFLQQDSPEIVRDVSLHRIESEQDATVRYSPEELVIAMEQEMELR